jgi:transposase
MLTILSLDLGRHNQKTHGAIFRQHSGRERRFTCATHADALNPIFVEAKAAGVTQVFFEAQPAAFRVADLVRSHGLTPVIANTHAEGFAARSRSTKSDKLDVDRLAGMALRGEIAGIHIPSAMDRERRSLVELRASLVSDQTATKNRIRGLAEQEWLTLAEGEACWTTAGLSALQTLAKSQDSSVQVRLEVLLDQLDDVARAIRRLDRALAALRAKTPAAKRLLTEMPGFGPATTDAFLAFIGDPSQTGYSSRSAAAATGLAPTQRQSGKTTIAGPISKAGNATLRGYLVEAAQQATIRYPEWKALKRNFTKGRDDPISNGKAIVAVARRLAQTAAALLRSGTTYDPERITPKDTWATATDTNAD